MAGSWARAKTSVCGIAEMRWTGQQPANPASDWLFAVHAVGVCAADKAEGSRKSVR